MRACTQFTDIERKLVLNHLLNKFDYRTCTIAEVEKPAAEVTRLNLFIETDTSTRKKRKSLLLSTNMRKCTVHSELVSS